MANRHAVIILRKGVTSYRFRDSTGSVPEENALDTVKGILRMFGAETFEILDDRKVN